MSLRIISSVFSVALAAFVMSATVLAQEHDHASMSQGPNGGTIQIVGTQRIETVIVPKGIMFMMLDANGEAIAVPRASGSLKLRVGDASKEYPYELEPLKNNAIGVGRIGKQRSLNRPSPE